MQQFRPSILHLDSAEKAAAELERVGVDVCGISEMVPKMATLCVRLTGLACRQANILKQEMLSLGGDAAVARGTVACAVASTDVILIGTHKQLKKLCIKLKAQPFGLAGLAAELHILLSNLAVKPAEWQTSRRVFTLAKPLVMGILNVTPDSFSDGGRYSQIDAAVEAALLMEAQGADIIDIGGESTRPGAAAVSADAESERILPVIERLAARVKCAISVDTWKSVVAARALDAGAEIVNDISGLTFDSDMAAVAAGRNAGMVLMHTRGNPADMQNDTSYSDLLEDVKCGLVCSIERALSAGMDKKSLVADPGIGFGKDAAGNLALISRLSELHGLGVPLLVGTSRKSFIGKVLNRINVDDRLFGGAAVVALSIANGASIVRVHDVKEMRDVVDMTSAVMTG